MTNALHPPRDGNSIGDYSLFDFAAKWMMQQTDIAEIHRYQADNRVLAALPEKEPRVVLFGDSITEFWPVPSAAKDLHVLNRGIAGQNSSQMLLRFEDDVIALKPRVVAILAGTNDLRCYAGNPADLIDSARARISRNLTAMCDIAEARQITVILATLPPVGTDPTVLRSARAIAAVNQWITSFAASRGYRLVDYHSALSDSQGHLDHRYSEDGVHPNQKGYDRMWPLLIESLMPIANPGLVTSK